MATGQTILNLMEVLNQELQLQTGEADVVRGLIALNAGQDYFESLLAQHPGVMGGDITTVVTAASTEATVFPTGFLRIDRLQFIDPDTNLPAWDLAPVMSAGGHAWNRYWPLNIISVATEGKPRAYWTNGTNIYWDPLPNGVHTVRVYGLAAASDIIAGGTFAYPDIAMLPLATAAVRLMRTGVDDAVDPYQALGDEVFRSTMQALTRFRRDSGGSYRYKYIHET